MSPLARFVARLRLPARRREAPPLIAQPAPVAAELAHALEKRRLERVLRDHGLSRTAAASVVRDYFREGG